MGFLQRLGGIVLLGAVLCLAATVTAATGTIQINVHPGGGTVCLGTVCYENQGENDGTGTTTFENIEAGRYHMLNVYGTPGCKPYLGQIYLDPTGTALTRDIYLEKIPPESPGTATIRIFITPDGGKACLDRMCELSSGDGRGSWSVQFTDIPANTYHLLSVSNEGYETWSSQVRLLPGQTSTMTIALKPLPPGSTSTATPQPVPTPAPDPEATRADLPVWIPFLAVGLFCAAGILKRHGRK
jgi:hypothetical protein